MDMIVTPDRGRHKEIGQLLFSLADDPSQVQWVSWPQAGYKVPKELFDKFQGVRSLPNTEQADQVPAQDTGVTVRRRPGRPRKNPVSDTDNTEKEE